jgi:hypothetical protein
MSRYIRKAAVGGGSATSSYGDSDVCQLLSSGYTQGRNICCIRSDWEIICECTGVCMCLGCAVEFTLPDQSTTCLFNEYKIELNGIYNTCQPCCHNLFAGFGNSSCYCCCCFGKFIDSTVCTFYRNVGSSCCYCDNRVRIFCGGSCGFAGGNVMLHIKPMIMCSNSLKCDCGVGDIKYEFNTWAVSNLSQHPIYCCTRGRMSDRCGLSWCDLCRIKIYTECSSMAMCICGFYRVYARRHNSSSICGSGAFCAYEY